MHGLQWKTIGDAMYKGNFIDNGFLTRYKCDYVDSV